jgi:hypothetical protein
VVQLVHVHSLRFKKWFLASLNYWHLSLPQLLRFGWLMLGLINKTLKCHYFTCLDSCIQTNPIGNVGSTLEQWYGLLLQPCVWDVWLPV